MQIVAYHIFSLPPKTKEKVRQAYIFNGVRSFNLDILYQIREERQSKGNLSSTEQNAIMIVEGYRRANWICEILKREAGLDNNTQIINEGPF